MPYHFALFSGIGEQILKCVKDAAVNVAKCVPCMNDIPKDIAACSDPLDPECWSNIAHTVYDCYLCGEELVCAYDDCCTDICTAMDCKCHYIKLPFSDC